MKTETLNWLRNYSAKWFSMRFLNRKNKEFRSTKVSFSKKKEVPLEHLSGVLYQSELLRLIS